MLFLDFLVDWSQKKWLNGFESIKDLFNRKMSTFGWKGRVAFNQMIKIPLVTLEPLELKRIWPQHDEISTVAGSQIISLFCSAILPLVSTRWVQSTFSSLCPLSSKQRRWLTSVTSTIFSSEIFLGTLGIEPGAAGYGSMSIIFLIWWWHPERVWKGCCLGWQVSHKPLMTWAITLLSDFYHYIITSYPSRSEEVEIS